MTKHAVIYLVWLSMSLPASATIVALFTNTDRYIEGSHDLVLARCESSPERRFRSQSDGGLYPVEIDIKRILKGDRQAGRDRIATIYPMEIGHVYLLNLSGGLATAELSVVPLPMSFDLSELEGKDLKEQIQYIFSRHLLEVESELEPLLRKKALLEKSISDRRYEWYESNGPVRTSRIFDARTKIDPLHLRSFTIELDGEPLGWSEYGVLYFDKVGTAWNPYWEFAPTDASRVEDLVGKPLKARFYNMYSPGRAAVGWPVGGTAIRVSKGDVLLARTTSDLRRIFIVKIAQVHPRLWVRYATIQGN